MTHITIENAFSLIINFESICDCILESTRWYRVIFETANNLQFHNLCNKKEKERELDYHACDGTQ